MSLINLFLLLFNTSKHFLDNKMLRPLYLLNLNKVKYTKLLTKFFFAQDHLLMFLLVQCDVNCILKRLDSVSDIERGQDSNF